MISIKSRELIYEILHDRLGPYVSRTTALRVQRSGRRSRAYRLPFGRHEWGALRLRSGSYPAQRFALSPYFLLFARFEECLATSWVPVRGERRESYKLVIRSG